MSETSGPQALPRALAIDRTAFAYRYDLPLILIVAALLSIGLVMVASTSTSIAARAYGDPLAYFWRQSAHVAVAVAALVLAVRIPRSVLGTNGLRPHAGRSGAARPRAGSRHRRERSTAAPDGSGSAGSTCSLPSSRSCASSSISRQTSCAGRKRSGSPGSGCSSRSRCSPWFPYCCTANRITVRSSSCPPPCSRCCFSRESRWRSTRCWPEPPRSRWWPRPSWARDTSYSG